jgi:hypothetical protein
MALGNDSFITLILCESEHRTRLATTIVMRYIAAWVGRAVVKENTAQIVFTVFKLNLFTIESNLT